MIADIPTHVLATATQVARDNPGHVYMILRNGETWTVADAASVPTHKNRTVAFCCVIDDEFRLECATETGPESLMRKSVSDMERELGIARPIARSIIQPAIPPVACREDELIFDREPEPLNVDWAPILYRLVGWGLFGGSALAAAYLIHIVLVNQ